MSRRNRFVVRVSKRGRRATSENEEDFTFDSDRRTVKFNAVAEPKHSDVVEYRFSQEPSAGETELLRIEHGYPYTPAAMVMVSLEEDQSSSFIGRSFKRVPLPTFLDFGTGSNESINSFVDRRFLYVRLIRNGTNWPNRNGTSLFIKYSILDVQGME